MLFNHVLDIAILKTCNKVQFIYFQVLEAQTLSSIFKDNVALCTEVNEKVIQHFVHCIEVHGRFVEYLRFLQTIVKADNQFIRRCQDMVMQEVSFLMSKSPNI